MLRPSHKPPAVQPRRQVWLAGWLRSPQLTLARCRCGSLEWRERGRSAQWVGRAVAVHATFALAGTAERAVRKTESDLVRGRHRLHRGRE
jgi:hypothetical protein